ETIRFFMLRTHYRSPFNFSDSNLDDAKSALRRLYTALDGVAGTVTGTVGGWADARAAAFRDAMDDDFNTPIAVAVLFDLAGAVNRSGDPAEAALLKGLAATLGILQQAPREFLQSGAGLDEAAIAGRIEARARAKSERDFATADAIRKELATAGVLLNDTAQGTTWTRG
ncbi:MAG: DALR domain-containing protein, partial [Caldimonas sp.]